MDDHFWFLNGNKDDVIDLSISCQVEAGLSVTLLDSDGAEVVSFYDEDLLDVLLPATDWYVFEIALWDFDVENCQYDLIVTK